MDVVLTTYGTIKSEFSRGNGLLHRTDFFRIVLDEGTKFLHSSGLLWHLKLTPSLQPTMYARDQLRSLLLLMRFQRTDAGV